MSDYNYNNNQTPPENGNRPDFSYNWNGSEYNRGNRRNNGRNVAIIAIVVALLAVICISAVLAEQGINDIPNNDSSDISEGSSSGAGSASGENSDDNSVDSNVSVPEFTPSIDSDIDLSTSLTEIYENCSPACCTVYVTYNNRGYSIGSGFVIDAESGYIATNHHVIEGGDAIKVIFYDGTEYEAELINSDSTTDLAVLKIEAEGLVQVEFGNSDNLKIGQNVVAIGTPYSQVLAGTMTSGIISGVNREIEITNDSGKVIKTMYLIQTDCSINPGNSGGALFDMAGNVVGITSLKIVDEQFEGIGFAIPITNATDIFKKLIAGEDIDNSFATASPQIGITVYNVEDGLAQFRMNPRCEYPQGVMVADIDVNSAAYAAGLSYYDIIVDFNGEEISVLDDLSSALTKYKAGNEVTVKVFRFNRSLTSGEYLSFTFKLDAAE